jgi:hypothetical protein
LLNHGDISWSIVAKQFVERVLVGRNRPAQRLVIPPRWPSTSSAVEVVSASLRHADLSGDRAADPLRRRHVLLLLLGAILPKFTYLN